MTLSSKASETTPASHPPTSTDPSPAIPAVVVVNLGTPSAPTPQAVRSFLREFLSDRRVIEMHPAMWRPILEGIILPIRSRQSAAKYASIWAENAGPTVSGSPLMHWSHTQADLLADEFSGRATVRLAMRYGSPSIRTVLDDLHSAGHRRILILPAYPQYAASSTATVIDEVARWALDARDQSEIRTIRSFPGDPTYVDALAGALEAHWQETSRPNFATGDRVVASFHSIPQEMHDAGDPYRAECELTASLLRERLDLGEGELLVTYQSVFGPAQWIGPATIDSMGMLARGGTRRVDVICPGFMADCLETLEEICLLNREAFVEAGGRDFHYVPWANDSPACVSALAQQISGGLAGWI